MVSDNQMAFTLLLLLVFVGYFTPFLSLPIVFLFTFLLPGVLLVGVLKVEMNFYELLLYSIAFSVLFSTHLVYFLSLISGYSYEIIYASFALVSVAALFADFSFLTSEKLKPRIDVVTVMAAAVFILTFLIMANTLWVVKENGAIVTSGYNYGDFFVHLSEMQTVNNGNFPPQVPDYVGEYIRYHWFVNFHSSIISKVTGIFPPYVVQIESALYTALLFLASFLLGYAFTKDKKTAIICAVLVLLAGNFAYFRAATELEEKGIPLEQLAKQENYSKDMSFYQVIAPMDYMLVQRPQTIGIPLLGAIIYLVVTGYPDSRKRLLLAGLLTAMLAPFQYFAFASTVLISFLYIGYWHVSRANYSFNIKSLLALGLPVFYALPFLYSAFGAVSGEDKELFKFGWIAEESLKNIEWAYNPATFVLFYIANFGLMLFLAVPAMVYNKVKDKWFLFLWAAVLFVIPNVLNLSTWQWDMCKFFVFMWFPLAILSASTITMLKNRVLQAAAITFCVIGPVLFIYWMLTSQAVGFNQDMVDVGEWIQVNTPEGSVFVTGTVHNSPVDSIGGRLRMMGYGGIIWTHGYDWWGREQEVKKVYCGSEQEMNEVLDKHWVSYVYYSGHEKNEYRDCYPAFLNNPGFEKVYENKGVEIYERK